MVLLTVNMHRSLRAPLKSATLRHGMGPRFGFLTSVLLDVQALCREILLWFPLVIPPPSAFFSRNFLLKVHHAIISSAINPGILVKSFLSLALHCHK